MIMMMMLMNSQFSSPLQSNFNVFAIFSSKNIQRDDEQNLTYLYPC